MKTKLDIIQGILTKSKETNFDDIIKKLETKTNQTFTAKKKSYIFTDMNIDKRFIHLGDNIWDLRENHPYSKVHLPINEIYADQKKEEEIKKTKIDSEMKSFVEEN